jgi:hypothetical protein
MPAHGRSGGKPTSVEDVAGLYASAYPARGIVVVDQATEVLAFAQMLHQVAAMLRGPAFDQV